MSESNQSIFPWDDPDIEEAESVIPAPAPTERVGMKRVGSALLAPSRRLRTASNQPTNTPVISGAQQPPSRPFWQNSLGQPIIPANPFPSPVWAKWLASSSKWNSQPGPGSGWRGLKMLGKGGFGIVGLWERRLENGQVEYVVVKQSHDNNSLTESNLLKFLEGAKSTHVVRMVQSIRQDTGQGIVARFDTKNKVLYRLFLEYCDKGDMLAFIRRMSSTYSNPTSPLPELIIWQTFACLSLALCVLRHGTESPSLNPRWDEIGHFDIKPQNILLSTPAFSSNQSTSHHDPPAPGIFKLGDFGSACKMSVIESLSSSSEIAAVGTRAWATPEQLDDTTPNRRFGSASNVWQVGKCIYVLMRLGMSFDNGLVYMCSIPGYQPPFETFGKRILEDEECAFYSEKLRHLIVRCLARDPLRRPEPREVLTMCEEGLSEAAAGIQGGVMSGNGYADLNMGYPEP